MAKAPFVAVVVRRCALAPGVRHGPWHLPHECLASHADRKKIRPSVVNVLFILRSELHLRGCGRGGDRHTSGIDCRPVAVRDWSTTPSDHDTLIEVTSRHGDGRSFTLTPRAIRRCRAGLAALAAAFAATHVYHRCLICRRGRGGDRGCWGVLSVAATDPLCGLAVLRPGQRGGHEANPLHPGRHRPGHAHCVVPSGRRAAPSLLCANCSRATDGPHPASCPPWNCLP